ncbi:MAG TPA: LpqB family beta-propeller domain-containing protein [Streptosporangiaceae bacterium]
MTRVGLTVCAAAVCVAVASCASLPTSGTIPIKSLQGAAGQGQTGLQVVPVPPGQGWTAQEIVRGFLSASASFGRHHAVARSYLTKGFAKVWSPGWSATVVDGPSIGQSPIPHNVVTGGPQRAAVALSGQRFATLVTSGQDQAGSVVVAPASTMFRFSLVQQDGQWRIDSIDESVAGKPSTPAPKSLLLLTRPDFERDYLARNIYYFAPGSSSPTLVPDPVYIPQTGLVSEVRGLVGALLQPRCRRGGGAASCPGNPQDSSWLFGAVTTAFPRGVRTVRPVQVVGGVTAVVDLGNTAARTTKAERDRMAAQLAWSLTESPYGPQAGGQISSVELKFGTRTISAALQPALVPRRQSTDLYYQIADGVQPDQVMLRSGGGQPFSLPLPKQTGSQPFTQMAMSPAHLGAAVLAGCTGRTVYLTAQARVQVMVTKRLPSPCTSLSWDVHGNLWIAATSGTFELSGAAITPAKADLIPVQIPPLAQPNVKPVRTLRVAPDGVRVAMIVPTGSTSKIMIAAISKNSTFTYIAQTLQMLRVGSDLSHPTALSWLDPDHLLVLNQTAPGRSEIYEVPLNGGASTEIATPAGVDWMSAAWPRADAPPSIVVGIAATRGAPARIEQSAGALSNPDWQPLGSGMTPVFPG